MKILITIANPDLIRNIFDQASLDQLASLGDVTWIPTDGSFTQEAFEACIGDFDACLTSWGSPRLSATACQRATRLRFLGHAAGTLAPYLDSAVFERDITIINASEMLAMSTAECSLALMLAGAWNLNGYAEGMRNGRWSQSRKETVMGVYGQTIGIVGLGQISRQLIRYLQPLHPRILVHSSHLSAGEAEALGVTPLPLDELLTSSQIVSLHSTLTERTRGMIGARELGLMRDGALLVNTARSELVDSAALLAELRSGRLFAALDVFDKEPLDKADPLLHLPNVLCAPHIGGIAAYWRKGLGRKVVDALAAFQAGDPLPERITAERFRAMSAH